MMEIPGLISTLFAIVAALAEAPQIAAFPSAPPPTPAPSAADRVKIFAYATDTVYVLPTAFGVQMMIRFAADERIETVSIGDGAAWQVTPNKAATLLFVKPVEMSTGTNMTVVTSRRSYLFELARSSNPLEAPYLVKFDYPSAIEPASVSPPERKNTAYVFSGAAGNLPAEVFDDGRFTYFRWPETTATPAIFALSAEGVESLVNYSQRDGFQVVETIAPRFLLRNGAAVTTVVNRGLGQPADVRAEERQ